MSEIANPYGTPCSEAPADTGSPLNLTATKSVESLSQPSASSEQLDTLRRKIAELEEEKTCLALSAADAIKRAKDAEKRTAAAEAETAAAKQRAQDRHTEKIHANNLVRHMKAELDKQVEERRSYLSKAKACFDGLKTRIFELQCANKDQEAKNSEKIQSLEAQLNQMQTSLLSSEEEQVRLKTQSDTIIKDLNKVLVGRQSSFEAAEKAQASLKDELEQSKARLEQQEAEAQANEAILRESNQKLRKSESSWKLKFEDMQKRVHVLEKHIQAAQQQTKGAQQQAQSAQQQFNTAQQQLAAAKHQIIAAYQQVEAVKQQANLALAGAKNQYLMAVRTMRQNTTLGMFSQPQQQTHQHMLHPQQLHQQQPQLQPQAQFQVQPQPQQHSQSQLQHQSRFSPLSQLLPKPQPQSQPQSQPQPRNPPQQTVNPNKKRKLDSDSGTTQVLNSDPASQIMAPNGGHARFPSPRPDTLASPIAPVHQMPLAEYGSQSRITPVQQKFIPIQWTRSIKPQQSPYMQGTGLNNMANNAVSNNMNNMASNNMASNNMASNNMASNNMASNNMVSNNVPKPQPSPYAQGTNLNNIESLAQNNVSKPQDMPMDFNFNFSQATVPELNIDELVAMSQANGVHTTSLPETQVNGADTTSLPNTQISGANTTSMSNTQSNGTDNASLPNTQVNDPASGLGDSVMADPSTTELQDEDLFNDFIDVNGATTDPNTTEPQDDDLFKDLFDDNLLALFKDPVEAPSQDQA